MTRFNPRAPRGARPFSGYALALCRGVFQSTRPARGATADSAMPSAAIAVSIHAPRAGRDASICRTSRHPHGRFNPRAPRGARRRRDASCLKQCHRFNPRAPRGARLSQSADPTGDSTRFNPRAPRGARRYSCDVIAPKPDGFNPRAPRGARRGVRRRRGEGRLFQSTRPARGATPTVTMYGDLLRRFQSTRPARGATPLALGVALELFVSIHAPRAGRDQATVAP